jgi:hypothetical protein
VLAASIIARMTEAASTYETPVNYYQTTRRKNIEDNHVYTLRRENLKFHTTDSLAASDHFEIQRKLMKMSMARVAQEWK